MLKDLDKTNMICQVELLNGDVRLADNIMHFVPEKELQLSNPGIEKTVHQKGEHFEIVLTANSMAKGVFISTP